MGSNGLGLWILVQIFFPHMQFGIKINSAFISWNGFVPKNDLVIGFSTIWPFWPLTTENPVLGAFWWKITSTHKSWTDFYPKPHSRKKNLAKNSKAKAMWPPITKKAGLQDRPFLVFSYQQDLKVLKITLVFYCCGSLVIYILPVFSTVPWKKSLFENFMLWSRSCRISN